MLCSPPSASVPHIMQFRDRPPEPSAAGSQIKVVKTSGGGMRSPAGGGCQLMLSGLHLMLSGLIVLMTIAAGGPSAIAGGSATTMPVLIGADELNCQASEQKGQASEQKGQASEQKGQASDLKGPVSHSDLSQYVTADGRVKRIQTAADWGIRRQQILEGMQQAMGVLPSKNDLPPLDIKIIEDKRIEDVRRLSLTIRVEADDRLPLDLWLPAAVADRVDPTSLLHGASTTKLPAMLALHPTGALGKRIVAGEGPRGNRQYGLELARRGYVTLCPDYPSFGDYAEYNFSADRYVSGSMKAIFNNIRCVDLLSHIECVDANRLGVIGHSLGGHNAMFTAVFDARLKVVVSSCGWTPFHDYYGGNITGWTSDRYMPLLKTQYHLDPDQVPFDFYEVVAALAPRTFVSISPLHDSNFEVNGVRKAVTEARKIYALLDVNDRLILETPDCQHDFPAEMREKAYREIDRVLQHTPAPDWQPDYSGELPRIAPQAPADAIKTFTTAPGFEIQQIAAEPLLFDPVAAAFDADGRLYVIEMRDYSEQADEHLGRVRLLLDSDSDGTYDVSHVFCEGLSWPTAVTCYDGGIFVGSPPEILFLKDTSGDNKADLQTVVFTGFGRGNVQGLMNCLHWGPDNRIYGQTSSSGASVTCPQHPDRPALALRGRDFSFDPQTLQLRPESGGAQHGMCFDDWGNRFVCSNSDHAQAILYNDRYLNRTPQVSAAPARASVAVDGGQAPVFRTSQVEPWRIVRTRLRAAGVVKGIVEGGGRPAGYFTGSTGINVYRGDAWPQDLKGLLVVSDVGSNIVHRKRATADGVTWKATRIDEGREFVASTDVWFRPVQAANSPDGCLMLLDMYRETIEHPASLPPEIKKHLDLTSGRDRGRLYRLAPAGYQFQRRALPGGQSTAQLTELLNHPNGWHRDTAARLLFEQQDRTIAIPLLRNIITGNGPAYGRIHALNTLDGMDALTENLLAAACQDQHPRVRETAARLTERLPDSLLLATELSRLASDPDARVRLQTAFSLGAFPDAVRLSPLVDILQRDSADQWIRMAGFSSLQNQTLPALQILTGSGHIQTATNRSQIAELTELIVRQTGAAHFDTLASLVTSVQNDASFQLDLVKRMLIAFPEARSVPSFQKLANQLVTVAAQKTDNAQAPLTDRIAAVRALSLSDYNKQGVRLLQLLSPATPADMQMAAMETLSSFSDVEIAADLIDRWSEMSPQILQQARETILNRTNWTIVLLQAIEDAKVSANILTAAEIQRLTGHPDQALRTMAAALQVSTATSSRDEVIARYQPALNLVGNSQRGAEIFKKHCSNCHQLGGMGFQVGPNLATVANRGADSILINLLDPNREVNPAWRDYLVVTTAGRTYNGVIINESATSITLRRAEAKEDSLMRSQVDSIQDTGRSLMPEGLEKEIDPQAAADLISWIMQQK